MVAGHFNDAFGTIKSFQLSAVLWISGIVASVLLKYVYIVVLARVATGISMGFISCVVPVYITDIIPRTRRAKSLCLVQASSVVGTLLIFYTSFVIQLHLDDEYSFKITWACESIPALVLGCLSAFLPESPKWLLAKGNWVEAANVLQQLSTIDNSNEKHQNPLKNCSYGDLFKKDYFKYTIYGSLVQLFSQTTCLASLSYFFSYLCAMCGLEGHHRVWMVSVQYAVRAIFTFFPLLLLDRTRRKDSLVFGMVVLSVGFCAMAVVMALFETTAPDGAVRWRMTGLPASAVLALFLFIVGVYSSLVVSASWLYVAEIFPRQARGKGSSICMGTGWTVNAVLNIVFPYVFKILRGWAFMPVSFFCIVGAIVVLQFPETRDRNMIEMAREFNSEVNEFEEQKEGKEDVKQDPGEDADRDFDKESENKLHKGEREEFGYEMPIKEAESTKDLPGDNESPKSDKATELGSVLRFPDQRFGFHSDSTDPFQQETLDPKEPEHETSVEEVIEAYQTDAEYQTDSGSPYSPEDSHYSHDWQEEVPGNSRPSAVESLPGAANFLNFDTLRVALKTFYNQQKHEPIPRKKGAGLNANLT